MTRRRKIKRDKGFSLLEALIAIGLGAVLLSVFSAMLLATFFLRRTQYDIQATSFIQEELDSLRALNYEQLINRTDGNFLGISLSRGDWVVTDDGGDQLLSLPTAMNPILEETGLVVLPGNYREDFTLTTDVRALSSSPVGWGAGIAFRYLDAENHYRFRFTTGGIAFDKIEQGVTTTVWSQGAAYSTDAWYELSVVASLNNFTLKRNGVELTTVADSTFSTGDLALLTLNDALADFDDVSVLEDTITTSWDFETEIIGELPLEWQRMSPTDLPGGQGLLSIEDYLGIPDIKKATVNITWKDGVKTRNATGTTVISK